MTPPPHLGVEKFELCLKKHQASPTSHKQWCMPQMKPKKCPNQSWTKLEKHFQGYPCPPAVNTGDHLIPIKFNFSSREVHTMVGTGSQ